MTTKKPKKIGEKEKISSVQTEIDAERVKGADSVKGAEQIKRVGATAGVGSAGGVRKRQSTRIMSMQEREALFAMISEEAEKMQAEGLLPQGRKALVADAVKMAIDSAIIDEEE